MFNNLHVHSAEGSILDAILTTNQIVKYAKEHGQKAIAITEHGYMYSYVNFYKKCVKEGIKPIIGCEVYEVDDMTIKENTREYREKRYHLLLLAENQKGYHNLINIVSTACTDGFYSKPRIDIQYIKNNNLGEGIICLTACMAGRLSKYLERDKEWYRGEEEAINYFNTLKETFSYVACEIQSHDTPEQISCNKYIYDFSQKYNLPYVITSDAHMLSNDDLKIHEVFLEIGEGRSAGETYKDCCLQDDEYVHRILDKQFSYEIVEKGIQETQNIVNVIEEIDIGLNKGNIMPQVHIDGDFDNHEEYLRHLVFSTFDEKFGHMSEEEQEKRRLRLEEELPVLYAVEYTDYFIMLYMLAKEGRKREIPLGYSRGSGGNCLCLFMLNVTQIDSVKWDLDFSRFANLGRKSMAD